MNLPQDLQHEVAARAPQPGFDAVMERVDARRRRRRTTIASGLAAAVVVAGVAAVAGGVVGDARSPEPASPAPSPWDGTSSPDDRLPSDVVAVLDDDQLQLWSIAGGEDGTSAALWRGCDFDPCQFALVTRDGDEVFGEKLGASFPTVSPVPGGWLVQDARGTFRLSASGERAEIFDTGPGSGDVMAGDTAVSTADGWRLLRGDKLIPLPSPSPDFEVSSAYVTPDGQLVVASSGVGRIEHATLGSEGGWSSSVNFIRTLDDDAGTRTQVLAGNGDDVALVVLGDDPDGSVPVLSAQVSHDAGRTWVATVNLDTEGGDRVRNMSALAVGADGTTYLTTESHHLLRIDDQGDATPIQLSAFESSVFASGDEVCVVVERGRYDALTCSPDGLTEWADQPLPGLG
ncbi:hypothetical protein EUA06_08540 [Nocardioides glacieisoli]|uniref:Exo-alpha-sialidase n=1 Tax=Nocardioides glacieisoli TaxID=1168730 RepID=A0A4Q2RRM9_9ACTN|nr:hypothetical protein [Nocardioides glacieisoli]RYB91368.1 hypothetical protein EUA06_08540 [Nocardioides glacieisoli]